MYRTAADAGVRWEYKKLLLDWAEVAVWEETLNAFGADGWEVVVSVAPPAPISYFGMTTGIPPLVVLLKRARTTG